MSPLPQEYSLPLPTPLGKGGVRILRTSHLCPPTSLGWSQEPPDSFLWSQNIPFASGVSEFPKPVLGMSKQILAPAHPPAPSSVPSALGLCHVGFPLPSRAVGLS